MKRSGLRINQEDLVMVTIAGQIAHPVSAANPYRIGNDGIPRMLPATGGIVINHRIGDRCVGLAGDHIEPGVALHNNQREVIGARNGPNQALITYACVGNRVRVISGACNGQWGLVTGKHGGVDHVIADFATPVLRRLSIGDRMQIYSMGLGLRLLDYPEVNVFNCAPELLKRWGIQEQAGKLLIPVTHRIPSRIMGSGLGKNTVWRGDYDVQLFDGATCAQYGLGSLRFGDLVVILNADTRFGPSFKQDYLTFGVIIHSDSTVSGHGPGVCALLSGPRDLLQPVLQQTANLAGIFNVRTVSPPRMYATLIEQTQRPLRQRSKLFTS